MRNLTYTFLTPFVIVIFLLTSCVNDIFLNDRQYVEEYKINELNLLIVMDNSRSMADFENTISGISKIQTVSESIHNFITGYTQNDNNINYTIGITMTNLPSERIIHPPFKYSPGQLVANVITSDSFNIIDLRLALEKVISVAENNETLIEKGLSSTYEVIARSSEMTSNFRNTDFYKKENDLAILIISDEDDSSDGVCATNDACLSSLTKIKNNSRARITFHAIADELTTCHMEPLPQNESANFKPGAQRIKDIVSKTGGEFTRMCDQQVNGMINITDFSSFFNKVGKNLRKKFSLKIRPNLLGIAVYVNDALQTLDVDYTYDYMENAIIFNDSSIPRLGEIIKIQYSMW